MLAKIPIDLAKLKGKERDKEILRLGLIAELDAINLYEQLSLMASSSDVKKVLKNIANDEKTHVGEFQALLLLLDKDQAKELKKGLKEVKDLLK